MSGSGSAEQDAAGPAAGDDLLAAADALLAGDIVAESGNTARLAAFITRQAAEDRIDQLLAQVGASSPGASMRSKLSLLAALDDSGRGRRLAWAWTRLSAVCHQHAYELAPNAAEIRRLWESVADG